MLQPNQDSILAPVTLLPVDRPASASGKSAGDGPSGSYTRKVWFLALARPNPGHVLVEEQQMEDVVLSLLLSL